MEKCLEIFIFSAGFIIIALAAKQIGSFFAKIKLPMISGFLFTGIIAGPFILDLIPAKAVEKLRFIDEISLGFIAFAAGSELYVKELKGRFKSIKWVTFGLVLSTFIIGSLTFFILSGFISFMLPMSVMNRIAVSILAGAILVARSPSSAIAVINELRAKGPFTKTVMGVTVIMDVVVIIIFAVNSSIADALLTGLSFNFNFIILLFVELLTSLLAGYLLGKALKFILSITTGRAIKGSLILLAGYTVFILSAFIRNTSHSQISFEILLEPLLICMIGSFLVTNYSNYRAELLKILHDIGPGVYIVFFTLTGASLCLDILAKTWAIALILFFARIIAIFIGSFCGGMLAGESAKHNQISWMSYITQAGVGLGLAKQVAVEFPEWGSAFATIMISIIVLNQIIGPPLFKWAIYLAKEAHPRKETSEFDGIHNAIIFGLEGQSMALARMLHSHGWQVKIASLKIRHGEDTRENSNIDICYISNLTPNELIKLDIRQAETIITMLSDEENYQICELAYEYYGTKNLIVRLNDRVNLKRFNELGALIVDPATAIITLLDHFARLPSATSFLLGMEKKQEIIEFELRNPDLQGMAIRDLSLPLDIHILSVRRHGQLLISHGYTRLQVGDWMSVTGNVASLEQMMLRFDTNREYELLHLVERATPAELTTNLSEIELKEIIKDKNNICRDRFAKLIEESLVIDINRAMALEEFFKLVAETMHERLNTNQEILFNLLMKREKESSTAFSPDFAIPHIIIDGENTFCILVARCRDGIRFSELAPKVQTIFVLAGTMDERSYHLSALSTIAGIVQDTHFNRKWLRARDNKALRDVVHRSIPLRC